MRRRHPGAAGAMSIVMSCKYICDGCGKEEAAIISKKDRTMFVKPPHWFVRADDKGTQIACSSDCAKKVNGVAGFGWCPMGLGAL